jgi:mannose-1-phosphate guanylyltransferase/mannose-6-phosphate isomerase
MHPVETVARGPRYEVDFVRLAPHGTSARSPAEYAEHWVIVKGVARVTRGAHVFELHENESVFIPRRMARLLENARAEPLEVIQVRIGAREAANDAATA